MNITVQSSITEWKNNRLPLFIMKVILGTISEPDKSLIEIQINWITLHKGRSHIPCVSSSVIWLVQNKIMVRTGEFLVVINVINNPLSIFVIYCYMSFATKVGLCVSDIIIDPEGI